MRIVVPKRITIRTIVFSLSVAVGTAGIVGLVGSPSEAAPGDPDPTPTAVEPSTPGPTSTPTPTPTARQVPMPHLSAQAFSGQTVGTRTVVLRGTGLADIASVSLGDVSLGAPRHISANRIAVRVGPAATFAPGVLRFAFRRTSDGVVVKTSSTFRYVATTFRARELRWAWARLDSRTYTWGHSYIDKYDCANFTSHVLVAAGASPSLLDVSSTALRRKLLTAGAIELRDTQSNRARVRIGDVIQFDWHPTRSNPGDRDHTGLVTGLSRDAQGRIVVRYSAHTDGGNNPSKQLQVEMTMNRPHHDPRGKVYFLHLPY